MTFEHLGLGPEVLKAVQDSGYATPTPIQRQAIPYVLMGRDLLGCAQTGTGKTASFTLPMIDILASGRARARMPRSLILEPTRELATQVAESFERYGKYHPLSMALLIGGVSLTDQEKRLDRGVDVLIATPGRLLDLFGRGRILLADVKILVIDETDRMLDMGFIPDVERIVGLLPRRRQTLFFSATMPPEIRRLADRFLSDPKSVTVDSPTSAAETVTQALVKAPSLPKDKRALLRSLLKREAVKSALIFCNRKRDVGILYRSLARHGFAAVEMHGDLPQPVREATLARFKAGGVQLLVCSDVAARGLDIPKVSHVFNFDVPSHSEDYIHRIGRTGRAGRSGKAFMLATPAESRALAAIEKMLGRQIPRDEAGPASNAPPPTPCASDGGGPRMEKPARPNAQPDARPDAQPDIRPDTQPDTRPSARPDTRPAARPDTRPTASAAKPEPKAPKAKAKSVAAKESVAFGEHTPAFLLKPVRLAASV